MLGMVTLCVPFPSVSGHSSVALSQQPLLISQDWHRTAFRSQIQLYHSVIEERLAQKGSVTCPRPCYLSPGEELESPIFQIFPVFLFLFFLFYFMSSDILPECLWPMYVRGTHRSQKRILTHLELGLQMVMSHHMGGGNETQVLFKTSLFLTTCTLPTTLVLNLYLQREAFPLSEKQNKILKKKKEELYMIPENEVVSSLVSFGCCRWLRLSL